jgi:gas vesicle protein
MGPMANGASDGKLLIGLLVGVGLGLATALLLAPSGGARRRSILAERAREVADCVRFLGRGTETRKERKTERVGQALMNRIERARSAGL